VAIWYFLPFLRLAQLFQRARETVQLSVTWVYFVFWWTTRATVVCVSVTLVLSVLIAFVGGMVSILRGPGSSTTDREPRTLPEYGQISEPPRQRFVQTSVSKIEPTNAAPPISASRGMWESIMELAAKPETQEAIWEIGATAIELYFDSQNGAGAPPKDVHVNSYERNGQTVREHYRSKPTSDQ